MSTSTKQIIIISGALIHEGKVLLLLRQESHRNPGMYELPGGQVDFTEHPERALIRQFQEATGLLTDPFVPINTYSTVSDDGQSHYISITYLVEYADDMKDIFLSPEHSEYLWADAQQVDELFSKMDEEMFLSAKLALDIASNVNADDTEDNPHIN